MLEPDRRHLLLDALRPPPGMGFDRAVGTTFSLDLEALLLAPVAFALFDARLAESGDPSRTDPLAVMEAVRRHAGRIDLFCQTGQISIPPRERPILALLEDTVHPAAAQSDAFLFHPKVWCLRFTSDEATAYRLLVLSRNLTFDRSWDTVVRLDGTATGGPIPTNEPLVTFLRALPDHATRQLTQERTTELTNFAEELATVEWELPPGFDELRFTTSGIAGTRHTELPSADRCLVISPFLTDKRLRSTVEVCPRTTLVSRIESLDMIHRDLLDRLDAVFVLSDATGDFETDDPESAAQSSSTPQPAVAGRSEETGERSGGMPPGIHAKVVVSQSGNRAEFRTGSTNHTTAGWNGNVEFDIALLGMAKQCGVDTVLGTNQPGTTLSTLLDQYHRTEREPLPLSAEEHSAIELERYGRLIARMALTAQVEADGELYRIILRSDRPLPPTDIALVKCWLTTRKAESGRSQAPNQPVHLSEGALSLQALTSFFAFEVSDPTTGVSVRLVTNARLVGGPEDRAERLLIEQLKSKADVLRYLLFLLADVGDESAYQLTSLLASANETAAHANGGLRVPLLETMVRALSRDPAALGPIDRLITDLSRTADGRDLLPDGLQEIWPAIWTARSKLI